MFLSFDVYELKDWGLRYNRMVVSSGSQAKRYLVWDTEKNPPRRNANTELFALHLCPQAFSKRYTHIQRFFRHRRGTTAVLLK